MRKFFSVFAAWVLLLSNCNLMYADDVPVDGFIAAWDNDTLLPTNVYFDWKNFVECDINNPVRGCVKGTKNQFTWSFENPGDIEIKKMVIPTDNPWEFWIHLLVRGKSIASDISDLKICTVVVFDKSSSMWSWYYDDFWNYYMTKWEKWNRAKDGAIDFSRMLFNFNDYSKIWLVFFWKTWDSVMDLSHDIFYESTFSDVVLNPNTNIQDGLLHAESILQWQSWNDCEKKIILLMSDGQAQSYMSGWVAVTTSYSTAATAAIDEASLIKNSWIEIYTISYEMWWTTPWADWWNTLDQIATDDSHSFDASIDDIEDVYNNIFSSIESSLGSSAWLLVSIVDSLGEKILWDDISITEWTGITESWVVYSFPIRIDPTASWWINTNSWLVMNYINSDWDNVNLEIPADMSSEIYWKQFLNCSWSYPSWDWVVTWSSVFSQIRDEPLPANRWQLRWNNDSLILTPDFMFWSYTDKDNPGECEWTCGPWYTVNDLFNWCEKIEKKNTVNIAVSPAWFGTVSSELIVANDDSPISTNWNELTIWTTTVTATPATWDVQYTYEFSWRNLDDCGDILTSSCTIVAEFRRVKNIKLNIVSNNSEYWNVDVSSGYFYPGTLSLFTSGNELRVLKVTIWPTKTLLTSIASPSASDEYYRYRFVDWSIPDSCSGQYNFNDDCTVVANFERLANKYMITFVNYDWTVLRQSEMEYGSKPKYMWETPEKLVEWYTNTFSWWNPEINSTTIVEGAQVYTATFTSVANNYTVLFSWNGAVWNMPWQSFTYWVSQKLSKNSFVMDWYKFIWWNTESNWSWTWYADEESVKNLATSWVITLYAQWWVNTYVVVFSWNNNTSWFTSNQDMELWESENLNENNFVRDWYTFSWRNTQEDWNWKWYSDEELVNNLASSAWEIVTLFAQWTPNPYTIAFNGNWASTWVMESQSMVYDVERILNENKFVREWYSFKWWNTKSDWTWKPYADKALVKNLATSGSVTLYAQWWKNNSWWSSSWWGSGWWTKKKDDCPNGDFSWDYYDKKCWTDVNTWKIEEKVENKPVVIPVNTETVTKKCSIEWSKHSAEVNRAYVWACENWIIKSNTIQGAKLWEFLNRAEMAKIVTVFEMLVLDAKPNRNKDCSAFADSISWYNSEMRNYMITSCQLERMWIHTADHKPISDFMPKKFVSRAEFWTILSRVLWWNKYEASRNSSKYYVQHLNSLKWGTILSNINPDLKERRSYAILMIYRAAKSLWKA